MKKSGPKRKSHLRAVKKPSSLSRESLARALDALTHSPRFEIIKGVNIAELLKTSELDCECLSSFSLEDMARLGADEICKLKGLSAQHLRALSERIQSIALITPGTNFDSPLLVPPMGLMESCGLPSDEQTLWTDSSETNPFQSEPSFADPLRVPGRTTPLESEGTHSNTLQYRSTEAELTFLRLLQHARTQTFDESLRSTQLSKLWEPTWPDAPFEQQLTLKQLLALDIEVILKKRSFTAAKLSALTQLLEKTLRLAASGTRTDTVARSDRTQPGSSTWTNTMRKEHSLVLSESSVSGILGSALWGFEEFLLQLPDTHPLHQVLIPLDQVTDVPSLALLLSAADEDPIEPSASGTLKTLESRLKEKSPALFSSWSAGLSGPGIHLDQLCVMVPDLHTSQGMQPQAIFLQAVKLCIRALNAHPVTFRGKALAGYWSKSPALFPMLFESALTKIHANPAQQSEIFATTFPLIDPTHLDPLVPKPS